jgi:hypothetical protein
MKTKATNKALQYTTSAHLAPTMSQETAHSADMANESAESIASRFLEPVTKRKLAEATTAGDNDSSYLCADTANDTAQDAYSTKDDEDGAQPNMKQKTACMSAADGDVVFRYVNLATASVPSEDATSPRGPTLEEDKQFRHTPLDRSKPSIRLVYILQSVSRDGRIQCVIEHATVHTTYTCLSYRWGDPSGTRIIRINGKTFEIRSNLYDFMFVARL